MRRLLPPLLLLLRHLLAVWLLAMQGTLHALLRRRQSRRLRQCLRLPCLLRLLHGWRPRQLLRLSLLLLHGHGACHIALRCPVLRLWLLLLLWALTPRGLPWLAPCRLLWRLMLILRLAVQSLLHALRHSLLLLLILWRKALIALKAFSLRGLPCMSQGAFGY